MSIRGNPRKPTLEKTYISLLICFLTKAILSSSVPTSQQTPSLKPISDSPTGEVCLHIFIVINCRKFVGAARELKEVQDLFQSEEVQHRTTNMTADQQTWWHFSPAKSPHFGGFWEAGVCLMKQRLRKILGDHRFTYTQLRRH